VTAALAYLVRRLAGGVLVLLVLVLVTFFLFARIPSEPASFLIGDPRFATPEEVAEARHALGVDGSIGAQFLHYVERLAHGDLGVSWSLAFLDDEGELQGRPVGGAVLDAARVTGSVALGGMAFVLLVAVPLGVLAARRPNSWLDRLATMLSAAAIATHPLVVALLLQLFVGRRWDLLPQHGYCAFRPPPGAEAESIGATREALTVCAGPLDWAEHLILPWLTFGLFFTALYLRMTRARMIETLAEPYITTARAKGASEGRVVRAHALRNGMAPVLAMFGMDVALAAGMTVYVEAVFGLPGIGGLTVKAFSVSGVQFSFDLPILIGIILATGVIIIGVNLLVDAVQVVLNPRLRA
jgi:peptide/nickel transport system permease protein